MERLRSRKAEVSEQLDERRAAARFEPQAEEPGGRPRASLEEVLQEAGGAPAAATPPSSRRADKGQPPAGGAERSRTRNACWRRKKKAWTKD